MNCFSSVADGWPCRVPLVRDGIAPHRCIPGVVHLEHRGMDHEAGGRGAVPVVLIRLEEDAVSGTDHLDRPTAALTEADPLGDPDRLAVRMGVPVGARAGR